MSRSKGRKAGGALAAAALLVASLVVATSLLGTSESEAAGGSVRTYFVAADIVAWDFAPDGRNDITGQPFGDEENVFVQQGDDRIGRVYDKALFREYTDGTFGTLKPRSRQWQHLGMLGPMVRAVVGDTVRFVFKNNTDFPLSVHAHGVFYGKDSEGAGYDDGTSGAAKADDSVQPGETYTYVWKVPERAGPGSMDGSSVMWMYHSHVNEPSDTNAGLIGPIVVTKKGMARPDGSPIDVDREFVALYSVIDENDSLLLDHNIEHYAGTPATVDPEDDGFIESNLMHSINGYVYGNLPGLRMQRSEHVRWYLMGMGTEVDLHTPHWHGNTVQAMGMRTDVVNLLPMSMLVADMVPDAPGTWLFHCHVNDHIKAGMLARYQVM